MTERTKLLMLGLIAGLYSASLGTGVGLALVAGLTTLLRYPIKEIVGISLVTAIPTTFMGVLMHYFVNSGNILFHTVAFITLGAILGARLGTYIMVRIEKRLLAVLFFIILMLTGLKMLGVIDFPVPVSTRFGSFPLLFATGIAAGITAALFGLGGGIIIVPALNLFFGLSIHQAVATSLAAVLPITAAAALFHIEHIEVNKEALKALIPTALLGAVIGATTTNGIPPHVLRNIFGILLLFCAVRLITEKGTAAILEKLKCK
ncbi:MAG: sulfite exporter TauE/SafE family protein [Candidatus Omnitrophota bacterium]